jgi:hypothetical protein
MKFNGLTADTPKHLLLDAGTFYLNYDVSKSFEENKTTLKPLGATAGGGSFSAVPTVRQIAIDGAAKNVKELETIDDWTATMTAKVKELTAENIKAALGAATSATTATPTGYTKITGNSEIASSDYLDTITWVGKLSGSDTSPVIIVLKNALCLNGFSVSPADKAEAVVDVTFTAHYDIADMETAPFEIYYPTVA